MSDERHRFESERRWAQQLLEADAATRARLYSEINDQYYRLAGVPAETDTGLQLQLLEPYVDPDTVLVEIGAGSGGLATLLAPRVARYIAVEASAEVVRGRKLPDNVELVIDPSLTLDEPDASIDLAYSCHVVEHLHRDDAVALAHEMMRLLRPGGLLIWVTPNRLLGPHDASRGFSSHAEGLHLCEYSCGELGRLLAAAGFSSIHALAGVGRGPAERRVTAYAAIERWLDRLPQGVRRWLLSVGRHAPFRRLEQVALIAQRPVQEMVLQPFLHHGRDQVHSPIADCTVSRQEPVYRAIHRLARDPDTRLGPGLRWLMQRQGWLVAPAETFFRLHFVSLETTSTCNQKCRFCPVSLTPRAPQVMTQALFEHIADQLTEHRSTLQAVFLHGYNEPTTDPGLVQRIRALKERHLPVAFNSNGSRLSAQLIEDIAELGGIEFLSINLSTLDPERYRSERGTGHLEQVLANLDAIGDRPIAGIMEVAVLGHGDQDHQRQVDRIRERLAATRFAVKAFRIDDRAGALAQGLRPRRVHRRLRGCDLLGSRPLQHLHVTAAGTCVLCCQDYHEQHVVGDLNRQTVREVLEGPELSRLRRQIYGREPAPDDLLCRRCIHALT
jgi:SAM-dependent methyltransferase/pyruvate-formate lyase-activating enzyme